MKRERLEWFNILKISFFAFFRIFEISKYAQFLMQNFYFILPKTKFIGGLQSPGILVQIFIGIYKLDLDNGFLQMTQMSIIIQWNPFDV